MAYSSASKENVLTRDKTNKRQKQILDAQPSLGLSALDAGTGSISFKMLVLQPCIFFSPNILSYC